MKTMDMAITDYIRKRIITAETALNYTIDKEMIKTYDVIANIKVSFVACNKRNNIV